MNARIEAKVFGRVQMVMFRDFAQRKGTKLGLRGTVRNLSDGSVDVVAEGDKDALERFIALLHKGSVLSKVERVDVRWGEPSGAFTGFSIVYD